MIDSTRIKADGELAAGKAKIEIETKYVEKRPAGPLKIILRVTGTEVASGSVPVSAAFAFSTDCFDIGNHSAS